MLKVKKLSNEKRLYFIRRGVYILFHIGILQLTQNLDDAVKGFKQGLQKAKIEADFHYMNADGNLNELPKLARRLADLKVDLIFACSTPAAKAAKELSENIPVVFTPVFDPVSANLVDSMTTPGGKLTGMSGMVNADAKVEFIQKLLPNIKHIAMLYHDQDANSLIEVANIQKSLKDKIKLTNLLIHCQEDLSSLEEQLSENMDALFLPIGKIVEENFASIVYYADSFNIPIIASHAPNVSAGALGALVANHALLGEGCAQQARQILVEKISPSKIPVGITSNPEILLNAFVADNLDIELSAGLTQAAKEIFH